MNILFIGPYRQIDEWGQKSRSILKSIQASGHAVTSRPIYLYSSKQYNNYIEKSETIIKDHYDILIQFVLQPFIAYTGRVQKRIGIFNTETIPNNIPLGDLTSEMLMDEIWTDSTIVATKLQQLLNSYNSNTKVVAIPPSLNVEDLPLQHSHSLRATEKKLQNQFLFYYIGNILDEKSAFKEVYIAYLNSFTNQDPVSLVLALETPLHTDAINHCLATYQKEIGHITPVQHHPHVHIILPQEILNTLERVAIHIDCDCMIDPNYTLLNNSPVLESAIYKNTPIVNKDSPIYEWLGPENVWGIDSYEDSCTIKPNPSVHRFTYGESWHRPIIKSLGHTMKQVYIDKFQRDKKATANSKLRQQFKNLSYNNILSK